MTRPQWQTVMIVGAAQLVLGLVLLVISALAADTGFGAASGGIAVVGVLTVAVGVVLSWRRASSRGA